MAIAKGFNRFMCFKSQTAWGTKATGLAQTMVPLRGGGILEPNPFKQPREDAIFAISPASQYYDGPKFVPWSANFLLINPTSTATTLRDFFRTVYGKETLATGPPITKTYDINDPLIDGGTDTGTVLYGRALTLHEQCDDSAGNKLYADEVQDAVINEMSIVWRPDAPVQVTMRGTASDFQDDQTDITPAYPGGSLFNFRHVKNTTNGGLRVGTANPPTSSDNVVFSQATLTLSNTIRYVPQLGIASEAQIADRDAQMSIVLDVIMDVQNATAGVYDAADAAQHFVDGTGVNVNFLTYVDTNNILQFQATGATAACFVEYVRRRAPGLGAMQYEMRIRVAPAALTDTILKLTTAS